MFKRIILITVFGVLTGVVASLASVLFIKVIEIGNELLWITAEHRQQASAQPWFVWAAILVPTLGGLAVGLLCMTNSEKRPLTLADTIQSAQTLKSIAPLKSGLTTALASMVAISCGASVGQYGPLAHLGATLGAWISRITRRAATMNMTATMGIGCGAAAAIATAFNAPIAGLLFAHEVILRHYSLRSFAPITVSAATGYVFANYVFHQPPLFDIEILQPIGAAEFLVFIVIGVAGAYLASLFMRAVLVAKSLADNINVPQYFKPALAGAALGIVAIWLPEVLGIGESVLRDAVSGAVYSPAEMAIILIAKLILTALCLGFGFAGGIFSPALIIGILFGALIGALVDMGAPHFFGDSHSVIAVYAICGMVAVTGPVIGAPMTAILIVFELTRNYDLTIAAMVSVGFANLVGYRLIGRSIFDVQLKQMGFDLSMGRDKAVMDSRDISDYLTEDFVSVRADVSLSELRSRLIEDGKSEGYVLDENNRYIGTVSLIQLMALLNNEASLNEQCAKHALVEQVVLTPDTSIWSAMEKVQDFVGESIPVIANDSSGIMLGVVYEATIVKAYMDTLHHIRREEHGAD
ncbi:chloride channel protein [Candidatus Spongiihabitans sp.]|uniref:chloride channel protein n=1 Tax=Candidatus Spongiihabitans sp. TaxID=3101308 RepID=UPI003C7EC7C3